MQRAERRADGVGSVFVCLFVCLFVWLCVCLAQLHRFEHKLQIIVGGMVSAFPEVVLFAIDWVW